MGFKVGLALGGGAARGLAHLGVIKALKEAGIPIDIISGTSIGGLVGSIYATQPDIDSAIENVAEYIGSSDFDKTRLEMIQESSHEPQSYFGALKKYVKSGLFFAVSISKSSFISEETFQRNMEHILPKSQFEDLQVKMGIVAMNLDNAEEEVFTSGDVVSRVMASCSIPGIFPPIQLEGINYVDGSWINPVPVSVARSLGADFVIAVDVAPGMDKRDKFLNGFDITLKAAEGSRSSLKKLGMLQADIGLSVNLQEMHWADFSKLDECVEEGYQTVERSLPLIKKKLFWSKIRARLPI